MKEETQTNLMALIAALSLVFMIFLIAYVIHLFQQGKAH